MSALVAWWFDEHPPGLIYVWEWFCHLSDWREGGWGVGPLKHAEILAWAQLMTLDIGPSEVEALRRIDREFRAHHHRKDHPEKPPLSEQFAAIAEAARLAKEKKARG